MPFVCVDCGKDEIWTARQQQWWYEVAKGSVYSRAVRCHDCRQARREQQEAGSPKTQPIRHIGHLMKLVRAEVDRALLDAGFVYESRNRPEHPGDRIWIDYRRDGQTFSLAYEHCDARLIAELLSENGDCRTVAITEIPQPPSNAKLLETIKQFSAAIMEWLAAYRSAGVPRHPSRRE
ncbi:MAG TPA: zinc-ribbon domain-containing protein [Pirellulales bacterium]|nr:zinc-ribbon domain-containing protein [Pirellulales bacterium]